jgi:imidazolonepropionase-like amidohydrolase
MHDTPFECEVEMSGDRILVAADVLYDGKTLSGQHTIEIVNGRITGIAPGISQDADYRGVVTPAFIDAHSHIGMDREGEPWTESETNDVLGQILPVNDPLNSVYFDDRAYSDAVDFGVLYSCIVPGSGNLFGGRAKVIRNFAGNRKTAQLKDYGYKMALGFNPRSTTDWKGERPNTRMGVYAMLESRFDEILLKREKALLKKEKELHKLRSDEKVTGDDEKLQEEFIQREFQQGFTPSETAVLELIDGKKTAKVHVHKEDDVLYLIEFAARYGIKVTADHTCDVFHTEVFDELADAEIPVVYGPLGSVGYKVELKHAFYQNAGLLMRSRAFYGLMTDHPVIWTPCLRDSLKFFLIHGMKPEEAISLITWKNARILGIDDELGTIEEGKTGSLVVWNKDPLDLSAFPVAVIAEGRPVRERL